MSDIAHWLAELGLEKYVSVFAEAEIDFLTLPDLVEGDLKELGLPLGPRRRIWGAIKQLSGESDSKAAESSSAAEPSLRAPLTSDAERRHLSVMFVDLVGSTELTSQVDPEDMRRVITDYQNTVAGVVARHEGFVAKFMGDGVLCYFGWPRAREDDAERAVRAGLEIIDIVKNSSGPDGTALATRIGIASGVVIVGDLIGSGATQEAAVVGETPNLAARLQGIARANQLVLPQATTSLLGKTFELDFIGSHNLKGMTDPVDAYVVAGEAVLESRFAARQQGTLTPIVGREQELELMLECWATAKSGSGQMIVVSGEAGIGKSRISRAVIDEISQDDHVRITYQCSPYHSDSAFYPIIQQLIFAAKISLADSNIERLDKLEHLIGPNTEHIVLFAMLLGIDASERYEPLELTLPQLRARTMQALTQALVQTAAEGPLLVVFEDLHWVDPTTLELLDIALDAIADEKILILSTARPTFEYGFGGHPMVTRFALNRLGKEQILSISNELSGGKALPEEVIKVIVTRTDGVPLFVEELTKTILESGVLTVEDDKLVLDGPLDMLTIPNTLHDSLMARLDRLQPIKEVAQIAACIGREFSHLLLESISSLSDSELNMALEGLIKAELIYRRGLPPSAVYLFKHALVRDAAYESLLKEHRRSTHAKILIVLETQHDIAPEVLAYHAESAEQTDRAIDLWEAASKAAITRPAFDEGISHIQHAIHLVSPRIETGERAVIERALSLQVQLSMALLSRRGYGADETKAAFEYALVLADKIGNTPMRFPVLYGLWVGKYLRAEHNGTLAQAHELLNLAELSTETAPLAVAHRVVGISLVLQGRFVEAQSAFDQGLDHYDPLNHKGLENRFGQDIGIAIHSYTMINLMSLGETQRADKHAREVERVVLTTSHANTVCYAHWHLLFFELLCQDDARVERNIKAMVPVAREHELALWLGYVKLFQELIDSGKGDKASVERYMKSDRDLVATKSVLFLPYLRIEMGWRSLAMGLLSPAIELASMARDLITATGETFALSDLHRLEGALAINTGDHKCAERSLLKAIEVARGQSSKLWELRAAIDLAQLWHSNDRTAEAEELLRPIYDRIADGDCPVDRTNAAAMLISFTAP